MTFCELLTPADEAMYQAQRGMDHAETLHYLNEDARRDRSWGHMTDIYNLVVTAAYGGLAILTDTYGDHYLYIRGRGTYDDWSHERLTPDGATAEQIMIEPELQWTVNHIDPVETMKELWEELTA